MSPVTVYNGIEIYLTVDGEFYCNPDTNSSNYDDAKLIYTKLSGIKEYIDECYGIRIHIGNRYYVISVSNTSIRPVQVVRQYNDDIYFDDGTDTGHNYSMRMIHPEYVDKQPEFEDLKIILDEIKEIELEIEDLEELKEQFITEANAKLERLPMVDVRSRHDLKVM